MRLPVALCLGLLILAVAGCDDLLVPTEPELETCGPYPPPESSPYQLPFPVGSSSLVTQSNCGHATHGGTGRYATDFALDIGHPIAAARDGVVTLVREDQVDGTNDLADANLLEIRHGDGTFASYAHLMRDGVLVEVGDSVAAGQVVAISGNTGLTGRIPHLHFQVWGCEQGCPTIPVTFNNASPADPGGLQRGVTYTALPPGASAPGSISTSFGIDLPPLQPGARGDDSPRSHGPMHREH